MAEKRTKLPKNTNAAAAFFDQHSPQEAQAKLWEWFSISVTGGFEGLSLTEKEDLVTFYEQVRDLLVALAKKPNTSSDGE